MSYIKIKELQIYITTYMYCSFATVAKCYVHVLQTKADQCCFGSINPTTCQTKFPKIRFSIVIFLNLLSLIFHLRKCFLDTPREDCITKIQNFLELRTLAYMLLYYTGKELNHFQPVNDVPWTHLKMLKESSYQDVVKFGIQLFLMLWCYGTPCICKEKLIKYETVETLTCGHPPLADISCRRTPTNHMVQAISLLLRDTYT